MPQNTICFFFFIIYEKCIWYQFKIRSQKYARNKKERYFWRKGLQLERFSKVFPNVDGKALFWSGHQSKKLLKPWIRLQVFFPPSSLAYKLVNLLVFEKKSFQMSKNWNLNRVVLSLGQIQFWNKQLNYVSRDRSYLPLL